MARDALSAPAIVVLLIRFEPQPGPEVAPSSAPTATAGDASATSPGGAASAFEPFNQTTFVALPDRGLTVVPTVAAFSIGKGATQEASGIPLAPPGSMPAPPPAQPLQLGDTGAAITNRLGARVDLGPAANPLEGSALPEASSAGLRARAPASVVPPAFRSTADFLGALVTSSEFPFSRPSGADLFARALPFDSSSLVRAIDRFFAEFAGPDGTELVSRGPSRTIVLSVVLASTVAALELVRRRYTTDAGNPRIRHSLRWSRHVGFPELPGSWSSRLT
jgi:hypothetical protein